MIQVGTSGWSYKHWKNLFYPAGVKAADWLSYYAQTFSTTEINGCFYRLPTKETILKWSNEVPEGFLFCPKISRYLSHMKKLKDPEEPLERFFSVFDLMQEKLGPVLVQLPPMLPYHAAVAEHFYEVINDRYREYDFVMEVRHETWLSKESLSLMARYNVGYVISQSGKIFPDLEAVTAKNIYVRFHGPAELYASAYTDKMLIEFAGKFKKWEAEGHAVWAFFNNDIHGYAPHDAVKLLQLLENN